MSFLSRALLLFSLAGAIFAGDIVSLGDALTQQCNLTVDGNKFDLCPILLQNGGKWRVDRQEETPPTVTITRYTISLSGPIQRDHTLPSNLQCPEGTWICKIVKSRNPKSPSSPKQILETVPIAGVLSMDSSISDTYYQGVNATAQMVPVEDVDEMALSVRMYGGYYKDQPQSATIVFLCDPDEYENLLLYSHTVDGNHYFGWSSKQFCATRDSEPEPKPEEELVSPAVDDYSSAKVWTVILSSTFVVGLLAYLVYSPPKGLQRRVQSYLRDHTPLLRFRVGENVLVRWAHEELELVNEEEDHMINDDDGMDDIDFVEQIPLKPSPRMGLAGRLNGYGATK